MKSTLSKPLLRMASAHTSAMVGNTRPSQPSSSNYSTALSTRSPTRSSFDNTSTTLTHRFSTQLSQQSFSSNAHNARSARRLVHPWGTLALIGGVLLCLGTSTVDAFSFPFSNRNTPAARMKERLEKHGFIEKLVVPDGNCQMRALADQIHGDENNHIDVRSKIMTWLAKNEKFSVDDSGSATLGDFIDRDQYPRWMSYVNYMSRNGSWGDHITLVAASEVYGVQIAIISNVDDNGANQYMTNITPRSRKPSKTVNLSHWHEMHYNSLHPIQKVGQREL